MTSRASLCLALVVGACTGKSAEVWADLPPPTSPPLASEPGPAPPVRVQATATVLERSGGGPQLRAGQPCTDGESLGDGCVCEDRQCMDICCVGSACSHHASPEGGFPKCIRLPKKKRGE